MEESICRVCLFKSVDLQTVFTSVDLDFEGIKSSRMHLSEIICSFADVQITLGDGLPEKICTSCVETSLKMYQFKILCEENDKKLRMKLSNSLILEEPPPDKPSLQENPLYKTEDLSPFYNDSFSNDEYEDDTDVNETELPTKTVKLEKPKDFLCEICQKRFTREDLLLRHKIAHASKLPDFEDSDSEIKSEKCSGDDELKCFICGFKTEEDVAMNKHYVDQHSEINQDTITCKSCRKVMLNERSFRKHFKKHCRRKSKSQKFSCPHCHLVYSKKGNFDNHIPQCQKKSSDLSQGAGDASEGDFACDHCSKVFKSKRHILAHLSRVRERKKAHFGSRKPHICDICFKAFNQISNLKDHLRTHNGEKPFLCPTCGKGFNQLGNLRQHQVRHSGVKSHICTTCNHGFASKGELDTHLRKHTGARPFVCDVCGNGFTTSSSLTKHKRIHSGEKPYECDYCKMKFSRSGILSRHRRIHTGEKPYVCEVCKKAFTQSNDLNSHMRIHTGEKPYACDKCGQRFRQNSALRSHRKTHAQEPRGKKERQPRPPVFVEEEENILMVKFEEGIASHSVFAAM